MDEGKWKEVKKVSREELGRELAELARQLQDGRFPFQGMEFHFAENGAVERRLYLKDGRLYLSCSFSIWAGGEGVEIAEDKGRPFSLDVRKKPKEGPFYRKRLKKPMASIWKAVKKEIAAQNSPANEEVADLREMMDEYGRNADPEWLKEWESCVDAVEAALEAAQKGEWQEAQARAKEVDRLTKACHKRFK